MFTSLNSCLSFRLHVKPIHFVWFEHLDVVEWVVIVRRERSGWRWAVKEGDKRLSEERFCMLIMISDVCVRAELYSAIKDGATPGTHASWGLNTGNGVEDHVETAR